jgi:protoporphyrin/coproporphyrin ferrochelatase
MNKAVDSERCSYDAVLLLAYGGPTGPAEVVPFLRELTGDTMPEARVQQVAERYRAIGGYSPLVTKTVEQAHTLRQKLTELGSAVDVAVAMRTGSPSIKEALADLNQREKRRVLALVMSPFESSVSHGRYREQVTAARRSLGNAAVTVDFARSFYLEEGFIRASVDHLQKTFARLDPVLRQQTLIIFTAHSIPQTDDSVYSAQFQKCADSIGAELSDAQYRLAYQSRSGPGHSWLGPSIAEVIGEAADRGWSELVIAPIGFVCDNLEILYDLDIEAAAQAVSLGIRFHRAPTVGSHPQFIEALAAICRIGAISAKGC